MALDGSKTVLLYYYLGSPVLFNVKEFLSPTDS